MGPLLTSFGGVGYVSATYIHGYDDPAIIAGQGTLGLEVLEQVTEADAIVVPVGGGGLIAGVALAAKSVKPNVRIYGIEPVHSTCFSSALQAGRPGRASRRSRTIARFPARTRPPSTCCVPSKPATANTLPPFIRS
jgi:threonine dehydratase